MSKHNNVNPNFYQTAGRERTDGPDNGDIREDQKQQMNEGQAKVSGKANHPAVMRAKKK
ncbi:MAG TPA: hypothetical protein VGF69_22720 [Thermoanaerobaculia bacterium]|jgi:hypothetical protein